MEVNPMWFVAVGVFIALIIAYRHGRLAGFVAKVKSDEEKFTTKLASIGASVAADKKVPALKLAENELVKFGDEIKGWAASKPAVAAEPVAPQPTVEQRLAAVQSELDAIRALPKA